MELTTDLTTLLAEARAFCSDRKISHRKINFQRRPNLHGSYHGSFFGGLEGEQFIIQQVLRRIGRFEVVSDNQAVQIRQVLGVYSSFKEQDKRIRKQEPEIQNQLVYFLESFENFIHSALSPPHDAYVSARIGLVSLGLTQLRDGSYLGRHCVEPVIGLINHLYQSGVRLKGISSFEKRAYDFLKDLAPEDSRVQEFYLD